MCSKRCWWSASALAAAQHPHEAGDAAPIVEHGPRNAGPREVIHLASTAPLPADLPAPGSAGRWPWLRRLRDRAHLDPVPWLAALESGAIDPGEDLLAVLVARLDPPSQRRLLRWWRQRPHLDPALAALLAPDRDPATAAWLQEQLLPGPAALTTGLPMATAQALLPLLGHQRQSEAWPLLLAWLQAPLPTPLRRAALEGVARGLSAWPRRPLARALTTLANTDLDPSLAATAVDLLARLPAARRWLVPLRAAPLDPAVAARVERRLAALPPSPLLLLVHGRAGGEVPADLHELAAELERRRGAPVWLQALTAPPPPATAPAATAPPQPAFPFILVPLLLLPGGHVRGDVPALVASLRRQGLVRRWPFLGAWPGWQRALAEETAALAAAHPAAVGAPPAAEGPRPTLLHHPLEGEPAQRFLRHLGRLCAADCRPAPYSSADLEEMALATRGPVLPLALATNRLTEALAPRLGAAAAAPLLARPRLRAALLAELEALP
jgi:hypothetical protein